MEYFNQETTNSTTVFNMKLQRNGIIAHIKTEDSIMRLFIT